MRKLIGERHGVWIAPLGPSSSYRTYAQQSYFWNLYRSGRGNVAAFPGTSNHGLGIAVDVATQQMAYYIRRYGSRFGWSWDEGRRVGEWWHFRYVGGYRRKPDPLAGYPADERRWIAEYDRLVRANKDKKRRRVLRRVMKERRQEIWKAAQKSGWNTRRRRDRYRSLYARTN